MKTAIVTGVGSGIGKVTAKRLVADGWGITLNGGTESELTDLADPTRLRLVGLDC